MCICSSLAESGSLTTPLMMMEFADIENDLTINEMIIEKREEEILDLQSKVVDVNIIFRDLATIVSSQHEGLGMILLLLLLRKLKNILLLLRKYFTQVIISST